MTYTHNGQVAVVRPQTGLTADDTQRFEDFLTGLLDRGKIHFIISLAEIDKTDCEGLVTLIRVHQKAHKAGGSLYLADPSPNALRMLSLTRLDRVLPQCTLEKVYPAAA